MYEIALGIDNIGQHIMQNDKDMFLNLQAYKFRNSIAGNEHCYCTYCIELYYIVSPQSCHANPIHEVVLDIDNTGQDIIRNDKGMFFNLQAYNFRNSIVGSKHCYCMYCIELY